LTIPDADDKGKTARIDLPASAPPESDRAAQSRVDPDAESESQDLRHAAGGAGTTTGVNATAERQPEPGYESVGPPVGAYVAEEPVAFAVRPASAQEREMLFVPLAVNVGDGFKFGCGFFLALVLAMLIGFVLLAALFALTSLFGLNLPITR
jgi:hypothetical protein